MQRIQGDSKSILYFVIATSTKAKLEVSKWLVFANRTQAPERSNSSHDVLDSNMILKIGKIDSDKRN